jgi:ABC-type multidrug transport system ATPase subunit/ABC-type multidrug transport system permease subunit
VVPFTGELAIEARGLTKVFRRPRSVAGIPLPFTTASGTTALDGVDLAVRRGEAFGLVGPNGAGKSTLIKTLCTLVTPDDGTARVCGHGLGEERAIKAGIGLVTVDERSFFWRLSCRENLRFYAALVDVPRGEAEARIDDVAVLLGLGPLLDRRFDGLSTGMRHRMAVARGLLADPAVLFLDEPTRSLDPLAAARLRGRLRALVTERGTTLLLATHDLAEAVELCDRAAVMVQGRLGPATEPQRLRALVEKAGARAAVASDEDADAAPLALAWLEVLESATAAVAASAVDPPAGEPGPVRTPVAQPARRRASGGWLGELRKVGFFLRRDILSNLSYRLGFVLEVLAVLFFVGGFFFVGRLVTPANLPALAEYGGDYFSFVLVGIALIGFQYAALSSFSEVIRMGQVTGTLEAMLVTPTRLGTVLAGSALSSFLSAAVRVMLYLALGALVFGARLGGADLPTAFLALVLAVLAESGFGLFSAAFIMVLKRGDPVNFLLSGTATLLSGIYYPLSVLPGALQALAHLLPLTYALRAMRGALLLGRGPVELAGDLGMLAVFAVVLLPLGLAAFRWAVRFARRAGSLGQY